MPGGIIGISSGEMRIKYPSSDSQSIIAMLTQVSGVTSGSDIFPHVGSLPEFRWTIDGGTYSGYYNINRNDPQGLSYWVQATTGYPSSTYPIGFNQFYNYDHRTSQRYFDGEVTVNGPFPIQVELILNDDSGGGDLMYFGSAYANTGGPVSLAGGITNYNYFHNQPNTSFTHTIRLTNTGTNFEILQQLDVTDIDTGYLIYTISFVQLGPGSAVDFSHSLEFFRRTYITITI